jgi:hypothetical protein
MCKISNWHVLVPDEIEEVRETEQLYVIPLIKRECRRKATFRP